MKKRIFALLLALALLPGILAPRARAAGDDDELLAAQVLAALEVMVGDEHGELMLDAPLTRAALTKMAVACSSYRDSVPDAASVKPYPDVPRTAWYAPYVELARDKGLVRGTTAGVFEPERSINLAEAVTLCLRLLGYADADFAAVWPNGQMALARSLELDAGVTAGTWDAVTRRDALHLFYNLLNTKTRQGVLYAAALGRPTADGRIDYDALVDEKLEGPFVSDGSPLRLDFTPLAVYRDGKPSQTQLLRRYDVYYYNPMSKTVWMYTRRVSGKIAALTPPAAVPGGVTVNGVTYPFSTTALARQFSPLNGDWVGTWVTLLLDRDGKVAQVLTDEAVCADYYGVVQQVTETVEQAQRRRQVSVLCTDGVTRVFEAPDSMDCAAGDLLHAALDAQGVTLLPLGPGTLSGRVDKAVTQVGALPLADDLQVLDSLGAEAVAADRELLAGLTLDASNVRACVLDADGAVSRLILRDATGALWSYGFLTQLITQSVPGSLSFTGRYSYLQDGRLKLAVASDRSWPVAAGTGVALRVSADGALQAVRALEEAPLTALGAASGYTADGPLPLADGVQLYLELDGAWYPVDREDLTDAHALTGWYDSLHRQLRVILAREK